MILSTEDTACPLIFSAYLGDAETVESLLFSGDWPQRSLDRALMHATRNGWIETMVTLFIDGRPNPNYELSIGTQHACLLGKTEAVELSLRNGADIANLRANYVWLAHCSRVEVFKVLFRFDKIENLVNAITLKGALRGGSVVLLEYFFATDFRIIDRDPDIMRTAISRKNMHPCIPELIYRGAVVDGESLKMRDQVESASVRLMIRDANVRRNWRKVKSVALIWKFWQNWILDYYCPGNEEYPTGKGFLDAQERYLGITAGRISC